MKKISDKGIGLIKKHEGCKLQAYQCSAGVWTIGYGHTAGVKCGDVISSAEAEKYLKDDLKVFETFLNHLNLRLNQNQFDALISLIFNIGCTAFQNSAVKKKIQADPHDPTITAEFLRWNKSKGRVLAGLTKRRKEEADLYFS